MSARRGAVAAVLCGTAAVTGWLTVGSFDFGVFRAGMVAAQVAASPSKPATAEVAAIDAATSGDAASVGDSAIVEAALPVREALPVVTAAPEPAATGATPDPEPSRAQEATAADDRSEEHPSELQSR